MQIVVAEAPELEGYATAANVYLEERSQTNPMSVGELVGVFRQVLPDILPDASEDAAGGDNDEDDDGDFEDPTPDAPADPPLWEQEIIPFLQSHLAGSLRFKNYEVEVSFASTFASRAIAHSS